MSLEFASIEETPRRVIAPVVTLDMIDAAIAKETYTVLPSLKAVVCELVLDNGYVVHGFNACAAEGRFSEEIGAPIAKEDAMRKVWELLGFRVADMIAFGEGRGSALMRLSRALGNPKVLDAAVGDGLEAAMIDLAVSKLPKSKAAYDVLAERAHQRAKYGDEHDDQHGWRQLADAASCYAGSNANTPIPGHWPWAGAQWAPKDKRANLIRAAALALAAVECIDRDEEIPF
jgi:hypothetical protein